MTEYIRQGEHGEGYMEALGNDQYRLTEAGKQHVEAMMKRGKE